MRKLRYTERIDYKGAVIIEQFMDNMLICTAKINRQKNEIYLYHIGTGEHFRRRGFGRKMMDYVKRRYRRTIWGNWKNVDSKKFFEDSGAKFGRGRGFKIDV